MDELITKRDAIGVVNDVLAEYIPTFKPWQEGIPLKCALKIKALPPVYVPDMNVGDMISRQAAIDAVKKNTFRLTFAEEQNCEGHVAWSAEAVYSDVMEGALLELPSAQPKRGKWVFKTVFPNDTSEFPMGYLVCSECGSKHSNKTPCNFCDNCGADMRGEADG